MQSQESNPRSAGTVNHPEAAEWMTYLYGEISPGRKLELEAHLAECAGCGQQLARWCVSMAALDDWPLPQPMTKPTARWQSPMILKLAAAALLLLAIGFALGRQGSNKSAREVAELRTAVQGLADKIRSERWLDASNAVVATRINARDEMLRLFADYAKVDERQRAEDRQKFALALREMDTRLLKLRTELETVAVNTQNGFQRAQDGLTQLASFAAAESPSTSHLKNLDHK